MNGLFLFCLHHFGRLAFTLKMWHAGPYLLVGYDCDICMCHFVTLFKSLKIELTLRCWKVVNIKKDCKNWLHLHLAFTRCDKNQQSLAVLYVTTGGFQVSDNDALTQKPGMTLESSSYGCFAGCSVFFFHHIYIYIYIEEIIFHAKLY